MEGVINVFKNLCDLDISHVCIGDVLYIRLPESTNTILVTFVDTVSQECIRVKSRSNVKYELDVDDFNINFFLNYDRALAASFN